MRQGLRRLAQAHVVGQDAGDIVGGKALEPRQADLLIVAQFALEAGRRRDFRQDLVVAQLPQEGLDLLRLVGPSRHQIVDIDQQVGFGQRNLELLFQPAPAVQHRLQHAEQPFHPLGRQRQHAAVVEHELRLAVDHLGRGHAAPVDQPGQDGQQRPAQAVDLDTDIHVEPAFAGIAHHDSDIAGRLDRPGPEIGTDIDLPAFLLQIRDMGGEEGTPRAVDILAGHPVDAGAPVVQRALRRLDPELGESDLGKPHHGSLLGHLVASGEQGRAVALLDLGELPLVVRLDLGRTVLLAIVERQAQDVDQPFAGRYDAAQPRRDDGAALDDDGCFGLREAWRRIGGDQTRRRFLQRLAGGDHGLLRHGRSTGRRFRRHDDLKIDREDLAGSRIDAPVAQVP